MRLVWCINEKGGRAAIDFKGYRLTSFAADTDKTNHFKA